MKPSLEQAVGRFLGVRERSRTELERYLRHKGVAATEIEAVLNRWEKVGLVNDDRFMSELVRSYLHKGKGRLFLKIKLREAGIERTKLEAALGEVTQNDWDEAMKRRLRKGALRLEKLPEKEARLKAYRALVSSGFQGGEALRFIDDFLARE